MKYLAIFLLCVFLISCGEEGKVQPAVTGAVIEDEQPSQTTYNATMHFTNEGQPRGTLLAGRIRVYDTRRQTIMDSGVKVDFYDKEGMKSSVLTARWANINDQTKYMVAYDSVKIVSNKGTVVYTDSLTWDNENQKITSPAFVRIVENTGRVTTGHGFESDQTLSNYKILRTTIVAPGSTLQQPSTGPTAPRTNAPTFEPSAPVFNTPVPVDTAVK
jgi:LPS export ABC transporter protein LptC